MAPDDLSDTRLLELALKVTDQSPVDWDEERRTAADLSTPIEHLREIQAVAREYRRQDESAAESEPARFVWGSLRALEKLGEGGYGEVWRAWDPSLHRQVALKLRRSEDAARTGGWLREAQRLARVRHPNVLTVHGADVHDGRAGIWTDLVRGRTLEELLLDQGPYGPREAALIGLDLCVALAAVHGARLVHGDVKARNVVREGLPIDEAPASGAGRIVLMDFGTASERGAGVGDSPSAGTPLYAAPELLRGESATVGTDIYALGVLLYHLVTASYPIEADSMDDLRRAHEKRETRALRSVRPDLPADFVRVVERALDPDPKLRFRDAAEMERNLAAILGSIATTPRRAGIVRGRVVTAFLAGAAAVGLTWVGATYMPRWLRPPFLVKSHGHGVAVTLRQALKGTETICEFGVSISSSGDLDGDGIDDLLVGEPMRDVGAGGVHLYRGRSDGSVESLLNIPGPNPAGMHGYSVAHLGDINGDGQPDFAVGSPYDQTAARLAGRVSVYFAGKLLDDKPDFILPGTRAAQEFGYCVRNVGDLNGDGHADLAVGAVFDDGAGKPTGRVFLYFGGPAFDEKPDFEFSAAVPGSQFGVSLAGIGDFNGDGGNDIAIGANWDRTPGSHAGRVYIYYGGKNLDNVADLVLSGRENDEFGVDVESLGDFNGDGFNDLAIGAEFARGREEATGTVSVFVGGDKPSSAPAAVLTGPSAGSSFGRIGAIGDLNGDGATDLIVGAIRADGAGPGTGAAYVYFGGPVFDAVADVRLTGSADDLWFGISSSILREPTRPGVSNVIVGASGPPRPGAVYVFQFARHAFRRPRPGEAWVTGQREVVTWMGSDSTDLSWSDDEGKTWTPLATHVGGLEQNTLHVTVPHIAPGRLQLRLSRLGAGPKEPADLATVTVASAPK